MGNMSSAITRSKSYSEVKELKTPEPSREDPNKSLHVMSLVDPRSPNVDISRTPIVYADDEDKVVKGKHRGARDLLTKREQELLTPTELNRDSDSAFLFDPRSPTVEISRTPITVESATEVKKSACQSETTADQARFDDSGEVLKAARKNFDYDMSDITGQMCRDLRKRLFISQKLNTSDTELLNVSEDNSFMSDKEN